jgi:FtsH-binding integral membrane protein
VTAAFGVINHSITGRFWFYGAPIAGIFQRVIPPAPWWQGLWLGGAPSLWLLFPMAAAAVAVVVLFSEGRSAFRARTPAALFSWLFLGALAWMIWCQIRGNPVLGQPYHASILLPFSFLEIGARLWPELETARRRNYLFFCCALAVVLSNAWNGDVAVSAAGFPYPVWIGLAALVACLLLRVFPENMLCGVGGMFLFTALGVGPCYIGVDAHGYRNQYLALCYARERIEAVRQGRPVRFWYDKDDRAMPDATALNSTYSYSDTLLSQSFGTVPCGQEQAPATVIVAIGSDPSHGADFVASTLTGCWSGKGLRVVPVETYTIQRGASSYRLSLLRVERVPGTR